MTSLISEVAARSGFSVATLRYYEKIGLLAAPERADNGYRVYDEQTLARLFFIARAKQLGLDLAEVAQLVGLWAEDDCAGVQRRMGEFVAEKRAEATTRIAELQTFAAQLADVDDRLAAAESPAGPCNDECACAPAATSSASTVRRSMPPAHDPPIVCTLDGDAVVPRLDQWRAVVARAIDQQRTDHGRRLAFPDDRPLLTELARLMIEEQACCSFLSFSLEIGHGRATLEVGGPESAGEALDALFGDRS